MIGPLSSCCLLCTSKDVTEEDDKLVESAKADEARFRAFRCYFMIEALSASHKVKISSRF